MNNQKSTVFISYAREDSEIALKIYDDFCSAGVSPWIDKKNILPGDTWRIKIKEAIQSCSYFLAILSSNSVSKEGYVQSELKMAMEVLEEKPPSRRYLIPVIVDNCKPQDNRLNEIHQTDLSGKNYKRGFQKVLKSILPETINNTIQQPKKKLISDIYNEKTVKTTDHLNSDWFISSRHKLAEFMMEHFTIKTLKNFVNSLQHCPDIIKKLSDINIDDNKQKFVYSVVDMMIHTDCMNQTFFCNLTKKFPLNSKRINKLKECFVHDDPLPTPEQPNSNKERPIIPDNGHYFNDWEPTRRLIAIKLDRASQWNKIIQSCTENMNTFFLLHGNSNQSLTLFIERIERFLMTEAKLPHTVYRVPFQIEHCSAISGAQWENHILHALSSKSEKGSVVHHLYQKSYHKCLLLILGLQPLHDLKKIHLKGIEELITESLPKILEKTKPRNAIRFLMAIDYDNHGDNTHKQIDDWGLKAEESKELQYVAIPEVKFPTWDEVKDYLLGLRPRPDEITVINIKKEFETIKKDDKLAFQILANALERHIGDK